jgi:hypothetical protein
MTAPLMPLQGVNAEKKTEGAETQGTGFRGFSSPAVQMEHILPGWSNHVLDFRPKKYGSGAQKNVHLEHADSF